MDLGGWWVRRGTAIASVLAAGAIAAAGWSYTEQRELEGELVREMEVLENELADVGTNLESRQNALAGAVGEAFGPRLTAIERDLADLELVLFGPGGASPADGDVVGQLDERVARLDGRMAQLQGSIDQLQWNVQSVQQCLDGLAIVPQMVGDGFFVSC